MVKAVDPAGVALTLCPTDLTNWYGFATGDCAAGPLDWWAAHSPFAQAYREAMLAGDFNGPTLTYLSHRDLLERLVSDFLLPTLPVDLASRVTSGSRPMNHLLLTRTQDWEPAETASRMDELTRLPSVEVTVGEVAAVCESMFAPRSQSVLLAFCYLVGATTGPGDPFADSPMAPDPPLGQVRSRLLDLSEQVCAAASLDEMRLALELVDSVEDEHLDSPALMAATRLREAVRRARMVLR